MIFVWVIIWIIFVTFGLIVFRGAPYVPSRCRYIEEALTKLYPLSKKDVLVDIGSGDGIVLRVAASHGARAIGYELNPVLVIISRLLSHHDARVSVKLVDFWLTPLPDDTTIVYLFVVTRDVKKIVKKMQTEAVRLNRTLRVISYGNRLGDMPRDEAVSGYHLYSFHPLHS
jgi:hypothetical protein